MGVRDELNNNIWCFEMTATTEQQLDNAVKQ